MSQTLKSGRSSLFANRDLHPLRRASLLRRNASSKRKGLAVLASSKKKRDLFDEYEKWRKEVRVKWRLKKFEWIDEMDERKEKLKQTALMISLREKLWLLRQKLDPIFRVRNWFLLRITDFLDGFDEFVMYETKKEWRWSVKNRAELEFWKKALIYIQSTSHPSLFAGILQEVCS